MLEDENRQYLSLSHKKLIDDDMQLVASHAIINNTVAYYFDESICIQYKSYIN